MKNSFYRCLGSLYVLSLLALGCGSDSEVSFVMNETPFPAIDKGITSFDQIDSTAVYEIYEGNTVVFKDVTEPEKDERRRYWDLDPNIDGYEALDSNLTEYLYDRVGDYVVVLCVDNEKKCTKRAISVKEKPFGGPTPSPPPPPPVKPEPTTPKPVKTPVLKFIRPNVYSTNSPDDEFTISASVSYVSQKSDISLEVDGQNISSFNLSKGRLSAKIPLKLGKNIVKLTATNSSGSTTEEREFVYNPNIKPSPTLGFIQPSSNNSTVTSDRFDILVSAVNVDRKDQLTLTVGGKTIKDFSFSPSTGELTASVPLSLGNNTISVSANTSGGKTSQVATINYSQPAPSKPAFLNKRGNVGPSTSSYPASNDCVDRVRGAFSVVLSPSSDVELRDFYVFTDVCGGVKVEISGPDVKSHFQTTINAGRSQVSLADIDARLSAGNKYTLTLTPIAGYGTCSSNQAPSFYDVKSCNGVTPASSSALKLDQKGRVVLFDLKFSY